MTTASAFESSASAPRWSWLPAPTTWKYHALLGALGMLVLGPLGGLAASYMNFSIGFFVGGQVLAGILGSAVTYGYGAQGRHGANFIQTTAASVAGMSAMAVVFQAMAWMGMPMPPLGVLVLFVMCVGMYGAGIGMLYTPILVDRLQLCYPSGLAVANILRALTDPDLLRRSVSKLGGSMLAGVAGGIATAKIALLGATALSFSTVGAGLIVGARVGVPAIVGGLVASSLTPAFREIGWLQVNEPYRKITFLIALGMIMGASVIDMAIILRDGLRRWRSVPAREEAPVNLANPMSIPRLALWSLCWGVAVVVVGSVGLGQPAGFLVFALLLVLVFALVNGISQGLTDWNPISSAFVVTVLLMAGLGLRDPSVGLIAGSALMVAISVGSDMQQDRSTGWRLGSSRRLQFRYQVAGIFVGAIAAVAFAKVFMAAYPILALDQTVMPADQQPSNWASAMTYKLVGAVRSLTEDHPYQRHAIALGLAIGFATEVLRKAIEASARYRSWRSRRTAASRAADFTIFAVLLPSPYASSFGGFVNLPAALWFGAGGIASTLFEMRAERTRTARDEALPSDMSTMSLVGGGLIAGDAVAALSLGIAGLSSTVLGG